MAIYTVIIPGGGFYVSDSAGDTVTIPGVGVFAESGVPYNVYKAWKGAVEPAETAPSGNEYRAWKGAVEPVGAAAAGAMLLRMIQQRLYASG